MKQLYNVQSQTFTDIPDEEISKTVKFYKLFFKVWDNYYQEFTSTLTNAQQDVFLYDKEVII